MPTYPTTADPADVLADAGYVVDEWDRWQQGGCGTYACALIGAHPQLRLGIVAQVEPDGSWVPRHFVAHDGTFAYDSAGRHPLPYTGVWDLPGLQWMPDAGDPEDFGLPDDESESLDAAAAHAARHGIGPS